MPVELRIAVCSIVAVVFLSSVTPRNWLTQRSQAVCSLLEARARPDGEGRGVPLSRIRGASGLVRGARQHPGPGGGHGVWSWPSGEPEAEDSLQPLIRTYSRVTAGARERESWWIAWRTTCRTSSGESRPGCWWPVTRVMQTLRRGQGQDAGHPNVPLRPLHGRDDRRDHRHQELRLLQRPHPRGSAHYSWPQWGDTHPVRLSLQASLSPSDVRLLLGRLISPLLPEMQMGRIRVEQVSHLLISWSPDNIPLAPGHLRHRGPGQAELWQAALDGRSQAWAGDGLPPVNNHQTMSWCQHIVMTPGAWRLCTPAWPVWVCLCWSSTGTMTACVSPRAHTSSPGEPQ